MPAAATRGTTVAWSGGGSAGASRGASRRRSAAGRPGRSLDGPRQIRPASRRPGGLLAAGPLFLEPLEVFLVVDPLLDVSAVGADVLVHRHIAQAAVAADDVRVVAGRAGDAEQVVGAALAAPLVRVVEVEGCAAVVVIHECLRLRC